MGHESKEKVTREWMEMCLSAGFPYLTMDTAARVLVVFDLYNSEDMTFSPRLTIDLVYIRRRFHLEGGESPDPDFVEAVNAIRAPLMKQDAAPPWAKALFKERYGAYIASRRTIGNDNGDLFGNLTNSTNKTDEQLQHQA